MGESTETDDDGEKLYRYAYLEDAIATLRGRQTVKKYMTSNDEADAVGQFEIVGQWTFKFTCRLKSYLSDEDKKAGKTQTTIGTFGETSFWQMDALAGGNESLLALQMCAGCAARA